METLSNLVPDLARAEAEPHNRTLMHNDVTTPIGRLVLAGKVDHGQGTDGMRVYGFYALVFLLAGRGHYSDEHGNDREILPGDVAVVFPDIGQCYGPAPGHFWKEQFFTFEGVGFDGLRHVGLLSPDLPVFRPAPEEGWLGRLTGIAMTPVEPTVAGRARQVARFLEVVTEMMISATMVKDAAEDVWLREAQQILASDLAEPIDGRRVAQRIGMGYERFRKRFRDAAGVSPTHYRNCQRIAAARDMLRLTGMTMRQIAESLGYPDEFAFSRQFKSHTGVNPSQYRSSQSYQK